MCTHRCLGMRMLLEVRIATGSQAERQARDKLWKVWMSQFQARYDARKTVAAGCTLRPDTYILLHAARGCAPALRATSGTDSTS